MDPYSSLYREAAVLDRWADIYGGKTLQAELARLRAAQLRFLAELIKASRLYDLASWLDRAVTRWRS